MMERYNVCVSVVWGGGCSFPPLVIDLLVSDGPL